MLKFNATFTNAVISFIAKNEREIRQLKERQRQHYYSTLKLDCLALHKESECSVLKKRKTSDSITRPLLKISEALIQCSGKSASINWPRTTPTLTSLLLAQRYAYS